jgi:hypothetical protein
VNAQHTKHVPGRKSDVEECQWLLKLHAFGPLNNSFQPTHEIRIARTLWRQRGNLVAEASTTIQRMQKVLTEMNVQLSTIACLKCNKSPGYEVFRTRTRVCDSCRAGIGPRPPGPSTIDGGYDTS